MSKMIEFDTDARAKLRVECVGGAIDQLGVGRLAQVCLFEILCGFEIQPVVIEGCGAGHQPGDRIDLCGLRGSRPWHHPNEPNRTEEQAQWSVEAYQQGKTWGWVGPMFLWNLDYGVTAPNSELAAFGILGTPTFEALAGMPK